MQSILFVGSQPVFMIGFLIFVAVGLAFDLGVFSPNKHSTPTAKQALVRTLIWMAMGLSFSLVVFFFHHTLHDLTELRDYAIYKQRFGAIFPVTSSIDDTLKAFSSETTIQYLTGYFIEYSLSMDNLFVIMIIFKSFKVKPEYQKDVLLWGVIGAVLMRFLFIFIGGALIAKFHWVMYVFGAILVYSGFKLLLQKETEDDKMDTKHHPMVRFASKFLRVSHDPHHGKFFVRNGGKLFVTGLFVVLLVVEFSDVVFAVDSVPAIFGITRDPYLVFFSNIFAIMGLRSLFFLMGHGIGKIHTLHYGLSLILIFIGVKMLFEHWFKMIGFTYMHNLIVLFGILGLTVISAFVFPKKEQKGLTNFE